MSREALLPLLTAGACRVRQALSALIEIGLVRSERGRVLAEADQRVELTGEGTLRVLAEDG